MHLDLYLRDERVSPPARRLFESFGEAAMRLPVSAKRARSEALRRGPGHPRD
jgi:hypothetical protein